MVIDRRKLLIAAASSALTAAAWPAQARPTERFASAWTDGESAAGVSIFESERGILANWTLPARGHALARRPGTDELIVFARRPGRFAMVLDREGGKEPQRFDAEANRHFFGHGVFSSDGKLLFSTENDFAGEHGVLGIRDATDGYRPIGSFATAGVGPHDLALLADRRTLVVANGGIDTDPTGRDVVNMTEMRSSIAYVDLATGDLLDTVTLEESLRFLSIRHLAIAGGDVVAFGCQWQGEVTEHPPLVGLHRRGRPPVLLTASADVHRRLRGYIGSVAVDRSGEILAASSPKGGLAVYWDIPSQRFLGMSELEDVCGLASAPETSTFLLTSGTGATSRIAAGASSAPTTWVSRVHWDNHVVAMI